MKKYLFVLSLLILPIIGLAQNAVTWSYKIVGDKTDSPSLQMTATISSGFHMYAVENPSGGANPLTFYFDCTGCKTVGKPKANKSYTKEFDDTFEVDQFFYSGSVTFTQKIQPTDKNWSVNAEIKGQACNEMGCVRVDGAHTFKGEAPEPKKEEVAKDDPKKEELKEEAKEEKKEERIEGAEALTQMTDSLQNAEPFMTPVPKISGGVNAHESWWENVEAEMRVFSEDPHQQGRSLLYIFIAGFIGGLIALVTPCVWPMIPMTVSFFLKQNKSKKKSISTAAVYGLSIIVIYVALGIIVTVLFGASALNELATSAGFNIAFFVLLVIFAVSFMGGFELTLPSSWTNKMDSKVDATSGYVSIFFMAFTLALVSFSCTGPIIGTLLVEAAATSNFISPAVGMFGFALALALPFSLFAMFPTLLKSVPKSGGWMNTVKVVLGFLELALALKFLSVADLAYGWRILDREVFVALWIVIFALLGIYLLGKITFPHDDKVEKVGIFRFMLAVISLSFAVYMLPGLWGAPLKSISAFTPPLSTQDFSLYEGDVTAKVDDFEEGMKLSQQLGKPVLIDFSGYGCVNCRKMEAAVWTDPDIKKSLDEDFVLVTLMVDEKKELPEPIKITEKDGTIRTLRTYGDKWSYLQRSKFGANAQPYYVILDENGKPLAPSYAYNEDIPAYKRFLNTGIENYKKSKE
ncbi:MAG: thioredoxin family protein [Muribaculaceae bacterium]|nr:thioredoxin family protein [Muribaculaceae bacterium]